MSVASIEARLKDWNDKLFRLRREKADNHLLNVKARDLLHEDIEICQRRIRELEDDLQMEHTKQELERTIEEIEELKRSAA